MMRPFVPGLRPLAAVSSLLIALATVPSGAQAPPAGFGPGARVLLDAHNCYPDGGRWADRIDRALGAGVPVAIEQDLVWFRDPKTGRARSIVSHGEPFTGDEPSMADYFFERIRPIVEKALAAGQRDQWPLIVLNLDFKTDEPEHHAAIWEMLGKYESWLTTSERVADGTKPMPLDVKPVLVLTGMADAQEVSFHDRVPVGSRLRLFGAIRVNVERLVGRGAEAQEKLVDVSPADLIATRATNYRRWVNFPWAVVERGGQRKAADWTAADRRRLDALVSRAHEQGLWIRFYTLNGHADADAQGWTASYNFGSPAAVRERWQAAREAGVDFIATDQYEELSALLKAPASPRRTRP
ncbi:MAG TPA: hypothetical protein VIL35_12350 [Vicinamibacterales bacterium]